MWKRYSECASRFVVPVAFSLGFFYLALDAIAVPEQFTVTGGRASIACNITDPSIEDTVTLVLWYKGDGKLPIYTLDARKGPLEKARHFPGNDLGARASFDIVSEPAVLYLDPVHAEDDGIYKCRTEFKRSRTVTEISRLHVVVPPQEVIIMNAFGQRQKEVIGPYDEGSRVVLYCEAEGIPPPFVTWWRDSILVDDSFSLTTQGYVRNELLFTKLQRSDLMVSYMCQASNTNLSAPVTATISVDMNLRPLDVRIVTMQKPLSAGKRIQIDCESWGARPKAILTWWIDNRNIGSSKETTSDNLTSSSLSLVPSVEDNGKILTCRAQNPALENNAIENGWTLNVHYVPQLQLSLGANIHPKSIKEGSDVFFECRVAANPPAKEVRWFFEGRPLYSNSTSGVIISNLSLVLQKVRKEHRGRYQCGARNAEGEARSSDVQLKVRYAPVCRHPPSAIHGIARYEAVNVTCDVQADPPDITFKWTLNNTVESMDLTSFEVVNGTVSSVVYTPGTMFGYGVLLCWGTNSIGEQKEPCIIRVIPAGPPESVTGCTVSNQTISSLYVECDPGYDGGMRQKFHLEVYNSAVEHLTANLTSTSAPEFVVEGLQPSASFILVLYASNSKGKSNSVALMASTSALPERRTTTNDNGIGGGESMSTYFSPILAVLIGAVAVLVSIAVAILIIMKRHSRYQDKGHGIEEDPIKYDMALKKEVDDIPDSTVESPDVIPNTGESQSRNGEDISSKSIDIAYDYTSRDYSYDYLTAVRSEKLKVGSQRRSDDEITYAEVLHKEVPFSEVNPMDSPTDYAELDFQRKMAMAPHTRALQQRECSPFSSEAALDCSFLRKSPRRSRDSLGIPETTTETTPL